jgi:spore maturation protein CgeB
VLENTQGVVAFWDIDTPVTVAKLVAADGEYLTRELVPRFDLYLSFTGGPLLERLEADFGARRAAPFYCMADPIEYRPLDESERWRFGYLGTYSADRQPSLERFLVDAARRLPEARFTVAGPQYPNAAWPDNVSRIEHLAPAAHAAFYGRQRFTLNITRAAMIRAGWSPSVRLFEAAACGVPVISDRWDGLDAFFLPGSEILVVDSTDNVVEILTDVTAQEGRAIGAAARARVLAEHTPARRAEELEEHVRAVAAVAA